MSGTAPPRVSVLMSVMDAGRFVVAATESILEQTFRDFEFLIVDDGSSDDSAAIVERLARADGRIRFRGRENRGLTVTLNELVGTARGEYLARMDADDISLPDRFANQVAFLDAHPEVAVLGSAALSCDEAGRPIFMIRPPEDHEAIDEGNLAGHVSLLHPTVMMRKAAVEAVGGYRPAFDGAEDLDLWLRLAERFQLANLDEALIRYRVLPTSISGSRSEAQARLVAQACREAWARRGLPPRPVEYRRWRPADDRSSQRDFALRWGWQAWTAGNQSTARYYFLRALRLDPLSPASWRGVLFGALRGKS